MYRRCLQRLRFGESVLGCYLILNLVIFLLRDDAPADQFGGTVIRSPFDDAFCSLGTHSW